MNTSNPAEIIEQMAQQNERVREMISEDKTIIGNCFGGEILEEYQKLLDLADDNLKKTGERIREIVT